MFNRRTISAGLVYLSSVLIIAWVGLNPSVPLWPRLGVLACAIVALIGTSIMLYTDRS